MDKYIENKAREISEKSGLSQTIPFDPLKLASIHGIEVKNATFKSADIAGIIFKKDDEIKIFVSSGDPYNRKRFTIAHELGHYFLHLKDQPEILAVEYRTSNNNGDEKKEQEANNFAAALLMDEILVKSLWNDIKSVQTMAEIFQVSYESMGYRLTNLGLLL